LDRGLENLPEPAAEKDAKPTPKKEEKAPQDQARALGRSNAATCANKLPSNWQD
jgi:hypothetical protein